MPETPLYSLEFFPPRTEEGVTKLRGDLPSGSAGVGDFRYANELVRFIREETGNWFHIDVAAYAEYHPQSRTAEDDLAHFPVRRQISRPSRRSTGWSSSIRQTVAALVHRSRGLPPAAAERKLWGSLARAAGRRSCER